MSSNEVIIFGIGHLAQFLVSELNTSCNITGVSRSFSCEVNKEVCFNFGEVAACQATISQLNSTPKAVIINFPPQDGLIELLKEINNFFAKNIPVVFVSSTSIYSHGVVNEDTELNTKSRLYPCEQLLAGWRRPVCVVRPGGLFDKKRNPGYFFKNRSEIKGPDLPVNMVHTLDVARFIGYALENHIFDGAYSLVASTHPSKKEFYGRAMKLAGQKQPDWAQSDIKSKTVLNTKSLKLGFKYKFDNLLQALDEVYKN